MSESMSLVGLDVHWSQTHAAVLRPATGELSRARLRMAPVEVLGFVERLGGPVRAVYEAGPTGFVLARAARERDLDVRFVAPGLIPRAPGDRVKTDRRGAERLVRLLAAGELSLSLCLREVKTKTVDARRRHEDVERTGLRGDVFPAKSLLRRRAAGSCPAAA